MMDEREQTIGERRVRASFNPSANDKVSVLKSKTAVLINLVEDLKEPDNPEKSRCAALAQTAYEEAAMWAVKAATGP
jgi:hypothetical protein